MAGSGSGCICCYINVYRAPSARGGFKKIIVIMITMTYLNLRLSAAAKGTIRPKAKYDVE